MTLPFPDVERVDADLSALADLVEGGPGFTRRVFSEVDRDGRAWVHASMTEAGLEVHTDGAGNLVGVLAGQRPGPALVTGSHTDTVLSGGRFDGIVGVVGAIEVVRLLREAGVRLAHELRVVDFLGEEPNDHGISCVGSRAVAGHLTAAQLSAVDQSSRPMAEAMAAAGVDPDQALRARWGRGEVAAYVELHIEQGPHLEAAGATLGVVSTIAGIDRVTAVFSGRQDHAGTMPMDQRHDAACAAAEAVLALEALGQDGGVATTGRLEIEPGSTNVVPARAQLWAELRNPDGSWLDATRIQVESALHEAGRRRGVDVALEWLTAVSPVPMEPSVTERLRRVAAGLGHSWLELPSWAGHDAAHIAALGPAGMLFVPSVGGRSHCPEEETALDDVAVGIAALGAALVDLDAG